MLLNPSGKCILFIDEIHRFNKLQQDALLPYVEDGTVIFSYIDLEGNLQKSKTIPEGYYFVLGDKRETSLDSRNSEIGAIPKEDILGKVTLRIWPLNKLGFVK